MHVQGRKRGICLDAAEKRREGSRYIVDCLPSLVDDKTLQDGTRVSTVPHGEERAYACPGKKERTCLDAAEKMRYECSGDNVDHLPSLEY